MELNIRSEKYEITDAIREYAEKKMAKLDKYLEEPSDVRANILIKSKGHDQKVEVTIILKKVVLRAEESNKDLYAALDLVTDKIERQIRKNKTRMRKNIGKDSIKNFNLEFETTKDEDIETVIVKRKNVEMKPMDEEEAILQMELLGHSFFIFKNDKTDLVNVLYKREDGNYGIIEIN